MVEFALAQNICHEEALKVDSAPMKERKMYLTKGIESKLQDYARVG